MKTYFGLLGQLMVILVGVLIAATAMSVMLVYFAPAAFILLALFIFALPAVSTWRGE